MNVALHPQPLPAPFVAADVTILDVCAGFGMLAEAVCIALDGAGLRGRVVAHVERDAAAAAALVARMAASPLDQAPVFDDLCAFDGTNWRGCVDIVVAGLPCQPYSPAGKRRGNIDHRSHGEDGEGPIPHFLRVVGECRPAVVFCENVPAWVVGGHFRGVGEELCRLGYSLQSPVFVAAEDAGAPHCRERVFVMAVDDAEFRWRRFDLAERGADRGTAAGWAGENLANGRSGRWLSRDRDSHAGQRDAEGGREQLGHARQPTSQRHAGGVHRTEAAGGDARLANGPDALGLANAGHSVPGAVAHPRHGGNGEQHREQLHADAAGAGEPDEELGNAGQSAGSAGELGTSGVERRGTGYLQGCGNLPLFPPGRGDAADPDHPDWWAWAAVAAVDPALMPRVELALPALVDGMARSDALRIGGNGVVPQVAAIAFFVLFARALAGEIDTARALSSGGHQ